MGGAFAFKRPGAALTEDCIKDHDVYRSFFLTVRLRRRGFPRGVASQPVVLLDALVLRPTDLGRESGYPNRQAALP